MVHRAGEDHSDKRPVLIIIGGGFAGVLSASKMRKEFHVILVDAKEYFEYYPGICRAYVHPKEHRKLSRHYQPICDNLGVDFMWGEVEKVRIHTREVLVKEMSATEHTVKRFDYLLVTCGSQYGIDLVHPLRESKGTECLWYPTFLKENIDNSTWKGLDERYLAGRRKHLEEEFETLTQMNEARATILVLGAGFVGIEFATEVKYFFPDIDVVIVEQRDAPIGVMPKSCIKYAQAYLDKSGVKTVYNEKYSQFLSPGDEDDGVQHVKSVFDNIDSLSAKWGIKRPDRIYMAVGIRAITQFMPDECCTSRKGNRGGWVQCNKQQNVLFEGRPLERVFAAGNCCQIEGLNLPKNSFPGEDMAGHACHNIRVHEAKSNKNIGGCFGFLRPRKVKETHWNWGTGLCSTSFGPHDATLVAGATEKSGSGFTVLWGYPAALNKEFIRWSKVDQVGGGCMGTLVWKFIH